jgi:molybdopterin-guanine dinucleotide biosynthesis protein A
MSVEAFILVGGRSTRLGRDKAFERIAGKTLAERALRTVGGSFANTKIFFVTGNEVEFAIEAARLNARFVFDVIEDRGPLGGLYTALTHATADWVFILACDLPFVTHDLIARLAQYTYGEYGRFGSVVPQQPDGRLQPLCAFYEVKTAGPVVDEIIRRRRASPPMHEIVALLNPRIVTPAEYHPITVPPVTYFTNLNTEEDLERAREIERKLSEPKII